MIFADGRMAGENASRLGFGAVGTPDRRPDRAPEDDFEPGRIPAVPGPSMAEYELKRFASSLVVEQRGCRHGSRERNLPYLQCVHSFAPTTTLVNEGTPEVPLLPTRHLVNKQP